MGHGRKPHPSTAGQPRGVWSQPDLVELLDCSPILSWASGRRDCLPSCICCPVLPNSQLSTLSLLLLTHDAASHSCLPMLGSVALGATSAFCQEVLFPWLCIAHPSPYRPTDVYLSSKLISTWDLAFSRVPEGGNAASVQSRASPQTLDSTALALSSFHGTMYAPTPVPASQAFSTIQHSHCKTSPQLQGVGPCGYSLCAGTPQPLLYFLLLRRPEGATGQVVAMLLLFTASYVREEDGLVFRMSPPV